MKLFIIITSTIIGLFTVAAGVFVWKIAAELEPPVSNNITY